MNYIWITEYFNVDKNKWVPFSLVGNDTQKVALKEMRKLQCFIRHKFRVVKYVSVKCG